KSRGRVGSTAVFAAAVVAAVLPLAWINARYTGHATGFHLSQNVQAGWGALNHLQSRGLAFYRLFVSVHPSAWLSGLIAAPYLALWITRPSLELRAFRTAVPALAGWAA